MKPRKMLASKSVPEKRNAHKKTRRKKALGILVKQRRSSIDGAMDSPGRDVDEMTKTQSR